MTNCSRCGNTVTQTEVGLTLKLINRGTKNYLCYDCLAAIFHTDRKKLDEMVEGFRAAGCTLFPPKD